MRKVSPELIDASSPKPDTTTFHTDPSKTDWPDTPTIQRPRVSSTTMDTLPEVVYHHRTTTYTADRVEVPEIEEEEEYEQEYNISSNNLITHHNTHQESERIWKINNTMMK